MEALTSSLVTGLTTASTNIMTAIGDVVPVALTVLGAIMVVRWAIRTFKTAGGSKG